MFDEGLKVPVAEQQGNAVANTAGGNQCIDSLADGYAKCPEVPKISRGLDSNGLVANPQLITVRQQSPDADEFPVAVDALQDFGKYQIAHDDRALPDAILQKIDLGPLRALEEVNPYAGVGEQQAFRRDAARKGWE